MKAIQPWVEKVKSVYDEVAELDNNQLRELTKTIQQQVQSSADDIREKITALREKIEGTPIEDREVIFNQIDKLEKDVLERY